MAIITSAAQVPWTEVKSSNLAAYHYDAATKAFYLRFNKGKHFYVYADMEPIVVDEFKKAESHGKFFLAHIKDKFPFLKYEMSASEVTNVTKVETK